MGLYATVIVVHKRATLVSTLHTMSLGLVGLSVSVGTVGEVKSNGSHVSSDHCITGSGMSGGHKGDYPHQQACGTTGSPTRELTNNTTLEHFNPGDLSEEEEIGKDVIKKGELVNSCVIETVRNYNTCSTSTHGCNDSTRIQPTIITPDSCDNNNDSMSKQYRQDSVTHGCSRAVSETSDYCDLTDYTSDSSSYSPCLFSDVEDYSSDMFSSDGSMALPGQPRPRTRSRVAHASICLDHTEQQKTLFCLDCKYPLCLECKVSSEHFNHKATTLVNAASERRNQLKTLQRELNCQTANLSNSLIEHEQYKEHLTSNRQTVMDKLNTRKNYLHRLVDRWHGKMQLGVDSVFSYEMERVHVQIEDITLRLSDMKEEIEYLSYLLMHKQASDILALSKDLLSMRDNQEDEQQSEPLELYFLFNPGSALSYSDFGDFTANRMSSSCLGKNMVVSSGKLSFSFDTRSGEQISSRYSASGLMLTAKGNLLVTDLGLDRVQLFQPNGQRVLALDTLPSDEPSNAVMLPDSKTIMVACRSGLKLYSSSGKFGRKLHPDVECPNGLHLSSSGEQLIVTDHAHDGPFIHVFDLDGMTLANTIIGGKRAPSFLEPWYVTTDANGRIIVTDRVEHNVKIFSPRGILVSEFGGQGAQTGRFFQPAGVCVDRLGHILVADSGNNRVQMFTSEGHFCAVLLADSEHELHVPMDLVVDEQGKLLVLQANGILATYQYIY